MSEPGRLIPPHPDRRRLIHGGRELGCKALTYVKDENGLYSANPKTNSDAEFIPRITVDELKAWEMHDSIIGFPACRAWHPLSPARTGASWPTAGQ